MIDAVELKYQLVELKRQVFFHRLRAGLMVADELDTDEAGVRQWHGAKLAACWAQRGVYTSAHSLTSYVEQIQ